MNKKKLVIVAMALCMAAVLVAGGTLAYFMDYDYNTNVMVLGNVKIDQLEEDRNGKPYQDGLTLYPAVLDEEGNLKENVVDKFVKVKNTGSSDAFIRTLFAFEMGQIWHEGEEEPELVDLVHDYVGIITDEDHSEYGIDFGSENDPLIIEIQEVPYKVGVYYYNANKATDSEGEKESALEPGVTSVDSLQQVYLHSHVGNEFYDMLAGDENGRKEYKILVLSQAVQTEGFESHEEALNTAFGDPRTIDHVDDDGFVYTNAQIWFDDCYNERDITDEEGNVIISGSDHSDDVSDDDYDIFPEDPVYSGNAD